MISFYPGPSKLNENTKAHLIEAVDSGILSMNHRSPDFIELSKTTASLLREKLSIPKDYNILFISSATEAWEIIAQSLIKNHSLHIFNGAFGEKWMDYTQKLISDVQCYRYSIHSKIQIEALAISPKCKVICLTQNETSNGTQICNGVLEKIQKLYPEKLIAVDATSSMGGVALDFAQADIWFASVQKCFGLPSGLGILIYSPKVVEKANLIAERSHYNSFLSLVDRMKDFQTTHTPNILNIFLLRKILEERPSIEIIDKQISKRADQWYGFLKEISAETLITNPECRSKTVITLQGNENFIDAIKKEALHSGFVMGNGYGRWAKSTFRIANFPAYTSEDIEKLQKFLLNYYSSNS
ncbi:MAG: aminotransferase class V-fold PLP-dependent enzyme [Cytophagaceae bacterium]